MTKINVKKNPSKTHGTINSRILRQQDRAGKRPLKRNNRGKNKSGLSKNRTESARKRQERRSENGKNFRYLSQRLTSYVPIQRPLKTPFGNVQLELRYGKDAHDVVVSLPRPTDYEKICQSIDDAVGRDKIKALASEIDAFLRLEDSDEYKEKSFIDILNILLKNVKESDFFDDKESEPAKAAAVLSAVLFVCEPSKNRSFDGGKLERASLKFIVGGKNTFSEVYGGKAPIYVPADDGGTEDARSRSKGTLLDKKKIRRYTKLEKQASPSSSEDESSDLVRGVSSERPLDSPHDIVLFDAYKESTKEHIRGFSLDQLRELSGLIADEISKKEEAQVRRKTSKRRKKR